MLPVIYDNGFVASNAPEVEGAGARIDNGLHNALVESEKIAVAIKAQALEDDAAFKEMIDKALKLSLEPQEYDKYEQNLNDAIALSEKSYSLQKERAKVALRPNSSYVGGCFR
jgi:hypothetical protein